MDYQNGKRAEMTVTFSLEEFRRPQGYILGAFAVIIILLTCLGWAGYRLHQTHRKLVVAEATKEHMIYSITHDANQDLFVIKGKMSALLDHLENGTPPGNIKQDLKLTMESAGSIERYLNNLKDQQGLAKGRVEMLRETICMADSIHSVAQAFAEKMNVRGMAVRVGQLDQACKVSVDPQMLKRVLMNLMHNAVKYSPKGGTVTIWQELRPDGLYTYVRDQGQGIPQEDWQRIFQPYVQLNPKKEGMGLGLATARQLVERLDGRLYVKESMPGQGTTMCLVLPPIRDAANLGGRGNHG
jgi:signal transduction histidine kinase